MIISDKTVRSDIMETYEDKLETVKNLVSQIPGKLSITLDGWTPRNVLPFLAIRWMPNGSINPSYSTSNTLRGNTAGGNRAVSSKTVWNV